MTSRSEMPTYRTLMYPTLTAVKALGGSATSREITDKVIESEAFSDEMLAVVYEGRDRDDSVLIDRLNWARSYCRLSGLLDSPRRGFFLLSELGQEILDLAVDEAERRVVELDNEVRAARRARRKSEGSADSAAENGEEGEVDESWRSDLLDQIHSLSPEGFEEFVIYMLKSYGMELERVGGSGDEGIDGIGTALLSPVLSTRVAVQAKRFAPSGPAISRDVVALFQRDAAAVGAEQAVLVTLARFSGPARKAANQATPNVELIDGDRLLELCLEKQIGLVIEPSVDTAWFKRFDTTR